MRMYSPSWTHFLAGTLALTACTGNPDPIDTSTGPEPEDEVYTINEGVPPPSGSREGSFVYSLNHPYKFTADGLVIQTETVVASAVFFESAKWGGFDLMHEEGCWTDAWVNGWDVTIDIGESLPVQVGDEAIEFLPRVDGANTLYTWIAERPRPDWAITPGSTIQVAGVDTGVIIPEKLKIKNLEGTYLDYAGAGDPEAPEGTLTLEWDPPTIGNTWIYLLRREKTGLYTRCHVRDDGMVTIRYTGEVDFNDYRLTVARISWADVELPELGRVTIAAEEKVIVDP